MNKVASTGRLHVDFRTMWQMFYGMNSHKYSTESTPHCTPSLSPLIWLISGKIKWDMIKWQRTTYVVRSPHTKDFHSSNHHNAYLVELSEIIDLDGLCDRDEAVHNHLICRCGRLERFTLPIIYIWLGWLQLKQGTRSDSHHIDPGK